MIKACRKFACGFASKKENPFKALVNNIEAGGKFHDYFSLPALNDPRLGTPCLS